MKCENWIPVTERLPDTLCDVLCTLKSAKGDLFVMVCRFFPAVAYSKEMFVPDNETCGDNVLAWMKLPDPYQGEQ